MEVMPIFLIVWLLVSAEECRSQPFLVAKMTYMTSGTTPAENSSTAAPFPWPPFIFRQHDQNSNKQNKAGFSAARKQFRIRVNPEYKESALLS
ncbi:MAG: hypothetical protein Q8T09_08880 [Candidatus Melainabacteria bacterium]|nr:hypothetical protein [Candidatus Melainabacteria bacterium]